MIERMILSEEECVAKTVLPNKITVIIPTCQSERKILMWSLLSLILRTQTKKDQIEHYIIGINGPDARTGDPVLQDEKQAMMEELRDKFDVPIIVNTKPLEVGDTLRVLDATTVAQEPDAKRARTDDPGKAAAKGKDKGKGKGKGKDKVGKAKAKAKEKAKGK